MKIKIDPLDKLFSLYIRTKAGWACERCGNKFTPPTSGLHNSHFYGRRKKSVRFDPENCAALCHGCHSHFTGNPILHVEWFKKRLGEKRFNALTIRANTPKKPDYELLKIYFKQKLKELGVV